jgi:hypothetical protein
MLIKIATSMGLKSSIGSKHIFTVSEHGGMREFVNEFSGEVHSHLHVTKLMRQTGHTTNSKR